MTTDNQSLPPLPATWNYKYYNGASREVFTADEMHQYATLHGDARAAHARKQALEEAANECDAAHGDVWRAARVIRGMK